MWRARNSPFSARREPTGQELSNNHVLYKYHLFIGCDCTSYILYTMSMPAHSPAYLLRILFWINRLQKIGAKGARLARVMLWIDPSNGTSEQSPAHKNGSTAMTQNLMNQT